MTLAGKQNHYNVKFLKGYGFSIKVKHNKLVFKNSYDPFKEPEVEEWCITNLPYKKIVLCGKGYISTEALGLLCEHNRNVILCDTYGKPISYMNPVMESWTGTKYRMGQYDTFRNPEKMRYLTKQIVKAKIQSQIRFLELTKNPELKEGIRFLKESLIQIKENPLANEAQLGRRYFLEFSKLIPDKYGFTSRNQSQIRNSKNNATDVINALLNYGYCVLAGEISKFVNGVGLDAYFGFYHKKHTGFQPLVYDLIEPFRWLVDYSVWKIATSYDIAPSKKQYASTKEGKVVMSYELTKNFLELLERTFQKERRYESRFGGAKTKDGLKSCQEITITKICVQNLADYCIGKSTTFSI